MSQCPDTPEEDDKCPLELELSMVVNPPYIGDRKQTWVLCKNCMNS